MYSRVKRNREPAPPRLELGPDLIRDSDSLDLISGGGATMRVSRALADSVAAALHDGIENAGCSCP